VQPLYTTPPAQEIVCSTGLCHYKSAAPVQPVQEPDHPFCDCGQKPHEMHLGWCAHAKSKVEWAGVAQKARYRAYIEAEWLKLNPPLAQPAPVPLTDEQRKNLWVSATIELPSQENCYYMGLLDAEAYHGITKGQP
jgi:hypothetical protein